MQLRFTLRQLSYFVAVGEAGSIARAAERMNISSPSISAAVGQLEAEFGLQLFVRKHAHGLALSQAGRQFMVQARAVLAAAESLNGLANDITGQVRGPLAIGCLTTLAQLVLPHLRRQFETRYPQVSVHQSEMHQAEIFEALRQARIDVALTYDLEIPSDLVFAPLLDLPPYAILAETHALADRAAVSVEDLLPHPMVLLDLPYSADYFLSFFTRIKARPNIAERTRDMAVMRSLVANGYGYGLANIRPVSDVAPDGKRLRHVPLTGAVRPMRLGLASAEGATGSLTIRAFAEHCRDTIDGGDIPGLRLPDDAAGRSL